MEFKGTKGKWEETSNNEEGILITSKHPQNRDILTIWKYDVTFLENQEAKANALLISKSLEMLEMLKKLIDRMEENNLGNFPSVIKAKELIKQATEL